MFYWIASILNELWIFTVSIFNEHFTIGNIVGLSAVIIAINTLNFSKRSFIVKDSYDPLLKKLKENNKVGLYNTDRYEIDFITEFKQTYIHAAFGKKEQNLMNEIIENANFINQFKNVADIRAKQALEEILSAELPKWKSDSLEFLYVDVKVTKDLFSNIINKKALEAAYFMGEIEIVCWIGRKYVNILNEDIYYDESKGLTLDTYLRETTKKSNIPEEMHQLDEVTYFLDSLEEKINDKFIEKTEFNIVKKKADSLTKDINKLSYILNESAKQLIIPYYKIKKIGSAILFWRRSND